MMFFWKLVRVDIDDICALVKHLRQKGIQLNWQSVGEVVHLAEQEYGDGTQLTGKFLLFAVGDKFLDLPRGLLQGDPARR